MTTRQPAIAFATAMLLLAGCRPSEDYPSRPIVLICPWSAGGGTDRVARQVAVLLERELGVPVNVINATGGAGVTGHTRGALADPDGYTLTMITVELNMLHWRGLTNIDHTYFEPLMMINQDHAALVVRADAPWRSLADLERSIREAPGRLRASGTAQGGIWHVALAGWLESIGLATDAVTWVSINGAAPSLQELLSGGVQMVCCSLPEAQTLLEAGEVRCLGVMADQRSATFPEIPTFREQGSDWTMGGWRGLALPRGVPRDRFEVLAGALSRVASSEEFRRFMDNSGFITSIQGPAEFASSLAELDRRFHDIMISEAFQSVRGARFGPYVFPYFLAGLLGSVFVWLLVRGELRPSRDAEPFSWNLLSRIALVLGWILGFVMLMDLAGYVIAGVVALVVIFRALRVSWPWAIGLAGTIVPLTYQVFAVVLRVPLPWGWFGW